MYYSHLPICSKCHNCYLVPFIISSVITLFHVHSDQPGTLDIDIIIFRCSRHSDTADPNPQFYQMAFMYLHYTLSTLLNLVDRWATIQRGHAVA